MPDAVPVSGQITGEAATLSDLEAVKAVLPETPVLANAGARLETVAEVQRVADGCIVGSALKEDGDIWSPSPPTAPGTSWIASGLSGHERGSLARTAGE